MSYEYSDPRRADEPNALSDVEVWHHEHAKRELCCLNAGHKAELYGECICDEEGNCRGTGFYFAYGFPGCLWDGEPSGPFPTYTDALAAAREGVES